MDIELVAVPNVTVDGKHETHHQPIQHFAEVLLSPALPNPRKDLGFVRVLVPPNVNKGPLAGLGGAQQLLPSFPLVREDAAGNLFHLELS